VRRVCANPAMSDLDGCQLKIIKTVPALFCVLIFTSFILNIFSYTAFADDPPALAADGRPIAETGSIHLENFGATGPADFDFTFGQHTGEGEEIEGIQQIEKRMDTYVLDYVEEGEFYYNAPVKVQELKKTYRIPVPRLFKESFVAPTQADRVSGIVFATIRGTTTAFIWYSNSDPMIATAMTIWLSGITYGFGAYHQTMDNLLTYGIQVRTSKLGKLWMQTATMLRGFMLDSAISLVTNGIAQSPRSGSQVLIDNTVFTAFNNSFNANRNYTFRARPELKLAYALLYKPLLFVLRSFQDLNKWPALFSIYSYPVTHSVVATIGIYSALFAANVLFKPQVFRATVFAKAKMVWIWDNKANLLYHYPVKALQAMVKDPVAFIAEGTQGVVDGSIAVATKGAKLTSTYGLDFIKSLVAGVPELHSVADFAQSCKWILGGFRSAVPASSQ
jgi:hypothetical protein